MLPHSLCNMKPCLILSKILYRLLFVFFLLFGKDLMAQTCTLKTHNAYTNFNSSPNTSATTLWVNIHIKLNGELTSNGDYLTFYGGNISLSGVTASWTTASIPTGKILADNTVSTPITYYDVPANTWITKVPLSYSSSELFISGGVITSTTGYTTASGKQDVLTGYLYSNKVTSTSWFYGLAAYQPTFIYSDVAASGIVTAIQTSGLHSGVPTNQEANLVMGGSGGGGSNYTGSFSSTDNVTVCSGMPPCTPQSAPTTSVTQPTCSVSTATITVSSPSSGVTYSFDNGVTFQASNIKSGLVAETIYQVVVKDNISGCISASTPTVVNAQPATPVAPTTSVTQPT